MTGQQRSVLQSVRLLYLALCLAFLFVMNRLAFGQWLPLTTSQGFWFCSGTAALILGSPFVLVCLWLAKDTVSMVYYSRRVNVAGV
ncbi:MAG: hypothetical protein L6437_04520 [Kiritimatiellae bacterium]|nr:hypothetical protein [Kiritimatiellia bacterium]